MYQDSDIQESDRGEQVKQPRGAKRRARTRADLLVAARHVFATHGYHDATITEITEAATVGVGTFYLHFHDKDDIFTTLLEEGLTTIREQVVQEMQHQDNPLLSVVIRIILHRAYEQRDLFRIALMAGVAARRFGVRDMLVQMFTRFLEHAPDLAPFSDDDVPLLAPLIAGILLQAINWWFEQDEPGPDSMAEHVLYVMRHGFPASVFEVQQRPPFSPSDVL
jgi:AcrR family transcriptional regulator